MKLRRLGRTGLKVSNLFLGAMTFGNAQWGCDEPAAARIVARFLDAGGNFIDTADVYSNGISEEITGRAIRSKRQQIVLATKVAGPMGTGPNDLGVSRKHILDAVDATDPRVQSGLGGRALAEIVAAQPTASCAQGPQLRLAAVAERGGGGVGADRQRSHRRSGRRGLRRRGAVLPGMD